MHCLSLLGVLLLGASVLGENLVVVTQNGKVGGNRVYDNETSCNYYSFLCIPYAAAPVGDLRFQAPQPANNWKHTLATQSCAMCPQIDFMSRTFKGNEDCLKLNVYTPIAPETCKIDPLPVMVFIYGGEWRSSTSDHYGAALFMQTQRVILVTFNYRMGSFGFLSTGDEIVPGNNGLKDQSMAIRWVQENIAAFGGNPRKVTIFGSSTGGASVRYHMLSPMSKGLFIGGISHSSNELNTWSWHTTSEAVKKFRSFSKKLNCAMWDNEEVIECLSKIPARKLVETEAYLFENERINDAVTFFKPVTEVPNENAFLCKNAVDMLRAGEGNDVPLMIGLTENEGAFRYVELTNLIHIDKILKNLDMLLPHSSASWRLGYRKKAEIVDKVYQFYFSKCIHGNEEEALINYISDSWFLQGHNDLLKLLTKNRNNPIYQYVLTYNNNVSFSQWAGNPKNFGASHYDEELYLFPTDIFFPDLQKSAEMLAMINRMLELWTNFAVYQNPTPLSCGLVEWKPVNTPGYDYLDLIGPNKLVMKQNFHYERAEFWRNLAAEYGTDKLTCE